MRTRLFPATFALLAGWPLATLGAESWGLPGEEIASFPAAVVDVACELTGDCPAQCGAGARQLGLKTAGGKLVLAAKGATDFAGAVRDLLPWCGRTLIVDGLLATKFGATVFMLQRYKATESEEWRGADQFIRDWAAANGVAPDGTEAGEWFRRDPRVKDVIARKGRLGVPE